VTSPRLNGKVHIGGRDIPYGDFPAGLSNVAGDFNFDATRMMFENVTAEVAEATYIGGPLLMGGPAELHAQCALRSDSHSAIPPDMSWLLSGALRLSGHSQAATLSGRNRCGPPVMAEGFDIAGIMVSEKEPVSGPSTTSPFLRNLQFDIQADSGPDSAWSGAVRGFKRTPTCACAHLGAPIFLGHFHLLTGEMNSGATNTRSRGRH